MSLDVYLVRKYHVTYDKWITLEEKEEELFERNITDNLWKMANKAWIYEALWRPEEINAKKAKDIIQILTIWLSRLENNKEYFIKYNPENWWWSYDWLLEFTKDYLNACIKYPESILEISR